MLSLGIEIFTIIKCMAILITKVLSKTLQFLKAKLGMAETRLVICVNKFIKLIEMEK